MSLSQVGYFIAQYSTVELGITALLAILSNFQDLEAFRERREADRNTALEELAKQAQEEGLGY